MPNVRRWLEPQETKLFAQFKLRVTIFLSIKQHKISAMVNKETTINDLVMGDATEDFSFACW